MQRNTSKVTPKKKHGNPEKPTLVLNVRVRKETRPQVELSPYPLRVVFRGVQGKD